MSLSWSRVPRHWKYLVTADYEHRLAFDLAQFFPGASGLVASVPDFVDLYADGRLVIHRGYAWDGASGPTIDTESSMRGSVVHDALYQLIREGLLPLAAKPLADRELHDVCRADGMWSWRARLWHWAVAHFGGSSCTPIRG